MKICDRCKGKEKEAKEFGMYGDVVFTREGETLGENSKVANLCQKCFFKSFKETTGKDYLEADENEN